MEIISHRGYWKNINEKNTLDSFEYSFNNHLGTETDLRDYCGEVVISHDIPNSTCLSLNNFFETYLNFDDSLTLALNIKSDGLVHKIKKSISDYNIQNYFVFDMSIPDTLSYIDNNIKFYTRQSEFEIKPAFYNFATGIWLDSFNSIWYDCKIIECHLRENKKVAIVSSDLHKRNNKDLWELIKMNNFHLNDNILLCTDLVDEAKNYFIN
jgi:hypothetical protein